MKYIKCIYVCLFQKSVSKAGFICTICTRANLNPGCIFGHVNGVLRICTRVQMCSYSRGGVNLFAPGCKFAPRVQIVHMNAKCVFLYVSIGDFEILQTFSVYEFVLNDIKINFKLF